MRKFFLTLIATAAIALGAQAQTVTFTFGSLDGGGQAALDLDDKASGSTSMGGVTLTANTNAGEFNSTGSAGFGINLPVGTDNSTQFDTAGGAESMTFSFNMAVTLNTIDFNAFQTGDAGTLTYSGGTVPFATDPFSFPTISLAANEQATLSPTAGSSFSLQSLTVTVVPEPSTYAMMGLGAALLVGVQRFRRKTS